MDAMNLDIYGTERVRRTGRGSARAYPLRWAECSGRGSTRLDLSFHLERSVRFYRAIGLPFPAGDTLIAGAGLPLSTTQQSAVVAYRLG